jgi:hypothetical protein
MGFDDNLKYEMVLESDCLDLKFYYEFAGKYKMEEKKNLNYLKDCFDLVTKIMDIRESYPEAWYKVDDRDTINFIIKDVIIRVIYTMNNGTWV